MKTKIFLLRSAIFLTAIMGVVASANAQTNTSPDSLGLPGDHLNLYAVLEQFEKCKTLDDFEKQLNLEHSRINNLDLNNDGKTDYIRVIDEPQGDHHAIILRVPVSEMEDQDVAVIYIEKNKEGKVLLQIIGNEALYGKDYIIEPVDQVADNQAEAASANEGKTTVINNQTTVYVTVSSWPVVSYIYEPAYRVYASPWRWYHYPAWWSPWSPWYWQSYYGYYHHYHPHWNDYYRRTDYYRRPDFKAWYGPRSASSPAVGHNQRNGVYSNTYRHQEIHPGPGKRSPAPNPGYRPSPEHKALPANKTVNSKPVNRTPSNQVASPKPVNRTPSNQVASPKPVNRTPSNQVNPGNNKPPVQRHENISPVFRTSIAKPAAVKQTGHKEVVKPSSKQTAPAEPKKMKPERK